MHRKKQSHLNAINSSGEFKNHLQQKFIFRITSFKWFKHHDTLLKAMTCTNKILNYNLVLIDKILFINFNQFLQNFDNDFHFGYIQF